MKFNFKLTRLCGAYYGHSTPTIDSAINQWSGSNIVYDSTGNLLISAVSNRVQVIDLKLQTVRTIEAEARSNVAYLALSPDDNLLIVVDVKNYGLIINFHRGIVLHRLYFHQRVRDIQFSPGNGHYLAITHGKAVQIWLTPSLNRREFSPLTLHRTHQGLSDDVTCVEWSEDGSILAAGSRDCTVRIWTVHTVKQYKPVTLSGHRRAIVSVYIDKTNTNGRVEKIYTISQDGALFTWCCGSSIEDGSKSIYTDNIQDGIDGEGEDYDAVEFFTGDNAAKRLKTCSQGSKRANDAAHALVGATWARSSRHFFHQDSDVTATAYNDSRKILSVGFSSGLFGLYELPNVANIHTLSVGTGQLIKTCTLNRSGEWLALGCPSSQQLLVWEWQSETYVLKQRGHSYGMRCMAYSPDGVVICTGGEDGKLKLWSAASGFCYVTLDQSHTAPVTCVAFASSSVVVSASLDGSVRAHDLHRYLTFKTFTTPTPVQFISLAVDPSGEIVCAGTADPFHIYVWSMQTAKVMDVFTGHTGPICGLQFQPMSGVLVSASWDGTVKLWDLYKGDLKSESLQHTTDVICVACRPDGKQICSGTIGGLLSFWNVEHSKLMYEIDGRRDIAGGRKMHDRMTATNNASSRHYTSVSYSADGSFLLAGGNSKYVCIYSVSQQILLKKIQITFNRSLDGVLDELNSKNLLDGVPIDDHADSGDDFTSNFIALPGVKRGDDGSRSSRVEVLTRQLAFSSTGREWAAVSGEGLHIYSLDDGMVFDPVQLTESVTPSSVDAKLATGDYGIALRMSIHLNEASLIRGVIEQIPFYAIPHITHSIAPGQIERLMHVLSSILTDSPHIEFYAQWCLHLLHSHGLYIERNRATLMRCFRALYMAVFSKYQDLKYVSDENKFLLSFLEEQSELHLHSVGEDASSL